MSSSRRDFLRGAALTTLGLVSATKLDAQDEHLNMKPQTEKSDVKQQGRTRAANGSFVPVEVPDVPKLPYVTENGAKVFHLVAEVVKREFLPGKSFFCWGYNGSVPGPTMEIVEGDRVRIIVDNHLPEATSMHWHGLEIPIEMDGIPGISQPLIQPGERFAYEFTVHQNGTFFYHSHMPMQEMMGLIGFLIIHPKTPYSPPVDRDFGLILQEWAILPNNPIPNSLSMEFNWLTLNGKVGPSTTPRFVNLGMDHHPMHLHGNTFYTTGTEAGRVPETQWTPGNTVLVGVAQARDVEFDAKYIGDWMLHCHLPHHMMNHMVSMVGPTAHLGHGMSAGMGMEEGMGMIRKGPATAKENGPSMGRAMGVGATFEEPTSHLVGQTTQQEKEAVKKNPKEVPGFPQDHWMTMDKEVEKPETYGLGAGWTGAMMGMMTLVRVLPPDLYSKIRKLQAQQRKG
jgi:manganese oxidase